MSTWTKRWEFDPVEEVDEIVRRWGWDDHRLTIYARRYRKDAKVLRDGGETRLADGYDEAARLLEEARDERRLTRTAND